MTPVRPTLRTLNVGGELFTATESTWSSAPNSRLERVIQEAPVDATGHPFIDRDPGAFTHILHSLRYGAPPPLSDTEAAILREELRYYELPPLPEPLRSIHEAGTAWECIADAEDALSESLSVAVELITEASALDSTAVVRRYESILRVGKPSAFVHAALGIAYASQEQSVGKALEQFYSALLYEPTNAEYVNLAALALGKCGQHNVAVELLASMRTGQALTPRELEDNWKTLFEMHWTEFARCQSFDEKRRVWQRLKALVPTIGNVAVQESAQGMCAVMNVMYGFDRPELDEEPAAHG